MPGYEVVQWFGMLLPANAPKEITTKLHAAIALIARDSQLQKVFTADGIESAPSTNADEFGSFIKSELVKWATVVKQAGITQQ